MKTLAITHLPAVSFKTPFAGLTLNRIFQAFEIARERRALRDLSPSQLKDIGMDPVTAEIEANRSFWDLPEGR